MKGPWVPLLCIGLGVLAIWGVIQISPEKSMLSGQVADALSRVRLPDSLQFLEGRGALVAMGAGVLVILWLLFRRPRPR